MKIDEPIPVTILTGFLGAGKSTLLNEFLSRASAETAVIVNEFGDVSIDHDLIQVKQQELLVTTTGCICCTGGSDLISSLFKLYGLLEDEGVSTIRRVIVETTGLADPAPIISQLLAGVEPSVGLRHGTVARHFRLSGLICVVDVTTVEETLDRHFECMKQLAFADLVLLTKTDLPAPGAAIRPPSDLLRKIRQINAGAAIIDRHDDAFDVLAAFEPRRYVPSEQGSEVEAWLALERTLARQDATDPPESRRHAASRIQTAVLLEDRPVPARKLAAFVELLKAVAGPQLLRLKGIVGLDDDPDRPVVLHAVQHAVQQHRLQSWPSDDRRTRIVVITDGLDKSVVENLFIAITGVSLRAKSELVLLAAGLSLLTAALVSALLFAVESRATWTSSAATLPPTHTER